MKKSVLKSALCALAVVFFVMGGVLAVVLTTTAQTW